MLFYFLDLSLGMVLGYYSALFLLLDSRSTTVSIYKMRLLEQGYLLKLFIKYLLISYFLTNYFDSIEAASLSFCLQC